MLGPSISSERSTVDRQDYEGGSGAAALVYPGSLGGDDASSFHAHHHSNSYASTAAQAAAELQHRAELQRRQQQLQQQELHQQQQLQQYHQAHHQAQQAQQQQQQQHQQQQMQMHLQQQAQMQPAARGGVMLASPPHEHLEHEYENTTGGLLTSKYIENEIIKTFTSKQYLVKYVKDVLSAQERCKIVINLSKPKAVYFQCERSGSFRTTVKDATKRQRVAYTKRNKCGFRLVANLYPSEKDKRRLKRITDDKTDEMLGETWILRMIEPIHNHPPEPFSAKKRKLKTRTLVEKPIHRGLGASSPPGTSSGEAVAAAAAAAASHYVPNDMVHLAHQQMQHPLHAQLQHQHMHMHDEGQPEVMGMDAPAAVDPNIDPNVDPTVAHDGYRLLRK